jgi:hypothetical protein
MKQRGYDPLAILDENMAVMKGTRPSLDDAAGLRVWKDVLPHVR